MLNKDKHMQAFHNDQAIKEKYLSRVIAHRKADRIIQGTYWNGEKGCATGCTLARGNGDGDIYNQYEVELGVPRFLARLQDHIFETLLQKESVFWPERFIDSINVGADLTSVWPKFAVWLLTDSKYGVIKFARNERVKNIIQKVFDSYSSHEKISRAEWEAYADDAADAADGAAADGAATYYALGATYYAVAADAADVTYYAAAATYYAAVTYAVAAYAVAAYAAEYFKKKIIKIQSEKLIELLKDCK